MLDLVQNYWPLLVVLLILIAAATLLNLLTSKQRPPYVKRERLITRAELRFFRVLQKAVMDDWEIFTMVRIADVLTVPENIPNRRKWLNQILAKHVDFVLCDPGTLAPKIAIELDDRSHEQPERMARDEMVNEAFAAAELPLLRIPVKNNYEAQALRELIQSKL